MSVVFIQTLSFIYSEASRNQGALGICKDASNRFMSLSNPRKFSIARFRRCGNLEILPSDRNRSRVLVSNRTVTNHCTKISVLKDLYDSGTTSGCFDWGTGLNRNTIKTLDVSVPGLGQRFLQMLQVPQDTLLF